MGVGVSVFKMVKSFIHADNINLIKFSIFEIQAHYSKHSFLIYDFT